MNPLKAYELPEVRAVTGPAIRPGGFALTGRAVEFCNPPIGAKVLDVGCGIGATAAWLEENHGLEAVGVDLSPAMLAEGRFERPSSVLVSGRAEGLPFKDHSFDLIFCECVLSLLDDRKPALAEFFRVLKPGARLVVADLYARRAEGLGALKRLSINSCLGGARPRDEIIALTEEAGFEPDLWEDHSDLLTQLAAKFVFEYGSREKFWSIFATGCGRSELEYGLLEAKPGYYLMAARKKDQIDG